MAVRPDKISFVYGSIAISVRKSPTKGTAGCVFSPSIPSSFSIRFSESSLVFS